MSPKTKKDRINSLTLRKKLNKLVALRPRNFRSLPLIHPFLFSLFPILFIYSNNLSEVVLTEVFPPIVIALVTTAIAFIILRMVLKNTYKAAVVTTVGLIIFFSYGHIFGIVDGFKVGGIALGPNKYLLLVSILSVITFLIILRSHLNLVAASKFLSFIGVVLILLTFINISKGALAGNLKTTHTEPSSIQPISKTEGDLDKLPDIYYIILDGYARESTLKKVHKYDNSEFINYLEEKGFYVADKSRTNYTLSLASLASSLNMKYLDEIENMSIDEFEKRKIAVELLRNGAVSKFLKSKGYTFVNIGSGWGTTSRNPYADELLIYKHRSEFVKMLFQTSALVLVERFQSSDADAILFALDKLTEIPDLQEPTFTFAHIVSPHPPYLFDRDGNKLPQYSKEFGRPDSWYQREDYIGQLVFINKKTKAVVEAILSKSKNPPIIIIQSDHGSGPVGNLDKIPKDMFEERTAILNAYYLPNGGHKVLYKSITPVNSFRKILNYYFKTDYDILEDRSYFVQYRSYFNPVPIKKD